MTARAVISRVSANAAMGRELTLAAGSSVIANPLAPGGRAAPGYWLGATSAGGFRTAVRFRGKFHDGSAITEVADPVMVQSRLRFLTDFSRPAQMERREKYRPSDIAVEHSESTSIFRSGRSAAKNCQLVYEMTIDIRRTLVDGEKRVLSVRTCAALGPAVINQIKRSLRSGDAEETIWGNPVR